MRYRPMMLLPEKMERESRFKLALRMGLPVFFLTVLLFFTALSNYFDSIPPSFYISAIIILGVMVYYFFFLIRAGFEERTTDPITGIFTREYLLEYLEKEISNGPYTLLLVSIENLDDINERYGFQNGDKVLREFARWVGHFIQEKEVTKFPIGHFKGGDIIVGFHGLKSHHLPLLELLCLKAESYTVDEIEVRVSGAIVDTSLTTESGRLIDELFDQQQQRLLNRDEEESEEIEPSEIEAAVITAVREKRFSMMFQEIREKDDKTMLEASVKLYGKNGKLIHQNRYMPVINRLGLSSAYDLMLFEHIVALCRSYPGSSRFAVPLFSSTLRNYRFLERVRDLVVENPGTGERLVMVLEEKEYHNEGGRFNRMLQSYRKMGIRIALDHLDSYHTTTLYFRELDVDIVRYDGAFGKYIKETRTQALLRGYTLSAHEMGIKSWIRMIEDEEGAKIADEAGIDMIQGNYIGTIAPLEVYRENNHEIR